MFITKKNYQKALDEQKAALTLEFERKYSEFQEREWRDRRQNDFENGLRRQMGELAERVHALEKAAGLAEEREEASCPYAPKTACF